MVDYSRWDKLSAELSDSDDDQPRPKVTRLDDNERVNIDQQGVSILPKNETVSAGSSGGSRGLNVDPGTKGILRYNNH